MFLSLHCSLTQKVYFQIILSVVASDLHLIDALLQELSVKSQVHPVQLLLDLDLIQLIVQVQLYLLHLCGVQRGHKAMRC